MIRLQRDQVQEETPDPVGFPDQRGHKVPPEFWLGSIFNSASATSTCFKVQHLILSICGEYLYNVHLCFPCLLLTFIFYLCFPSLDLKAPVGAAGPALLSGWLNKELGASLSATMFYFERIIN